VRPRLGDPTFGPTCACGGPKAKQARTCQPCHGVIRGYGSSPRSMSVGDEMSATVARTVALAAARASAEGELAKLCDEQARDEAFSTWQDRRWIVSLDAGFLYEVIAA
jgi:hypothetical protein